MNHNALSEEHQDSTAAGQLEDLYAEMPEHLRVQAKEHSESRRNFLKVSGLAAMGAIVASCNAEKRYSAPLLVKDEAITPGVPYYYASTWAGASSACGVLVKVRDGRPILVEGNPDHPLSQGGVSLQAAGSVAGLYDPDRLRFPTLGGKEASWDGVDSAATDAFSGGKKVAVLSGTVNGPAAKAALGAFVKATNAKTYSYDAVNYQAIRKANLNTHGVDAIPTYRFDKAEMIVSFGADFLGSWISPVEYSNGWSKQREMLTTNTMSRHVQIESNYSLTGSNADTRFWLKPSQQGAGVVALAKAVAKATGNADTFDAGDLPQDANYFNSAKAEKVAADLVAAGSKALVVADSQNVNVQMVVNAINQMLGAYGSTVDLSQPCLQYLGENDQIDTLIREMSEKKIDSLVIVGCNPVYELADGKRFADALKGLTNSFYLGDRADETGELCKVVATASHNLESWNDHELRSGLYSLSQPMVKPLWKTRSAMHSLLVWAGQAKHRDDYGFFVRDHWKSALGISSQFQWMKTVERGFHQDTSKAGGNPSYKAGAVSKAVATAAAKMQGHGDTYEIVLYQSGMMTTGTQGNNAWLHEIPDPITRVSWDNFLLVPVGDHQLGAEVTLKAKIDGRDVEMKLPAVPQPGMVKGTAAVALGYGRWKAGKLASTKFPMVVNTIGANAFPLQSSSGLVTATVDPTGEVIKMARLQTHDTLEAGRGVVPEYVAPGAVRQTTLDVYQGKGDEKRTEYLTKVNPIEPDWDTKSLWVGVENAPYNEDGKKYHEDVLWKLVINLNSCTGCAACVLACNLENNIPVVGKEEIMTRREMHWLRIDRYYSVERDDDGEAKKNSSGTDIVEANPKAAFQPMMCQHCNHAPCETVCPVNATNHSPEGLNQQVYNRCVGTRYCANNCPYKVRRFNWFSYPHIERENSNVLNLVLNPDVTIRTRGIMEKCTMCVQRLNASKLIARRDGKKISDLASTACMNACPTNAIVVGNVREESKAKHLMNGDRAYVVIGEVGTQPNVSYLTKVRNPMA